MPAMKLSEFMRDAKLDDDAMAAKVGCSAGAVRKWRYGERMPRPDQMIRLREATDGAVTADDFLPPRVPAEATTEAAA